MAELARQEEEESSLTKFGDQLGQANDGFGFYQLTEAPSPEPLASVAKWSEGRSPSTFVDESSGLVTIPDAFPDRLPNEAARVATDAAKGPWYRNLNFGDGLAGAGGLFGAWRSFSHLGDEAESVPEAALDAADATSSFIGGVGSIAKLLPNAPEWATGMAGPSGDMLASEVGIEAFTGGAAGAGAAGTALGTGAALVGAFTGGYSVGSSADEYTKQSGLLGEGVGLADGIGSFAADAGWDVETTLSPYIGETAGSVAGTIGHATALAGGLSLGTMAAPLIAGAGLTHGLATTVANAAVGAGNLTVDAACGLGNRLQDNGVLPAAYDTIGAIFGCY